MRQSTVSMQGCYDVVSGGGVTYISYGLLGVLALFGVELAIAVLVEHLAEDEVTIADDTITVEVVAHVWNPLLPPVLVEFGEGFRRLGATHPPARDFDFLSRGTQSVIHSGLRSVLPAHLLVEALVIEAEGLVSRSVE